MHFERLCLEKDETEYLTLNQGQLRNILTKQKKEDDHM